MNRNPILIGTAMIVHDAGRGETPPCPGAKFSKGDVVKIRRRAGLAHFPREAIVLVAVPPNFPGEYALADLLNEARPLTISKTRRCISYILGNEGDKTPYIATESDLMPSGKPAIDLGTVAREAAQ